MKPITIPMHERTEAPEVERPEDARLYQSVELTLDDGRRGTFVGPALVHRGEEGKRVVRIVFVEPRPLPDDMHFEVFDSIPKTKGEDDGTEAT